MQRISLWGTVRSAITADGYLLSCQNFVDSVASQKSPRGPELGHLIPCHMLPTTYQFQNRS